LYKQLRIQ